MKVVVDAPMAATGISGYRVICKAAEPLAARLARTTGITVAAAGIRLGFGEAGPGLRASRLPSLSNKSEKGGPVVAAAAFCALLRAARGDPEP